VSMVSSQSEDGTSGYILKAHTCPYFEVARNHREICDMEQEMIADLLGPNVSISLADRIVDGACACDFHVSRTQSEPLEFVGKVDG
jgi:predicted ArsR family transcriptional regulator